MPAFDVQTEQRAYPYIIERGVLAHAAEFIPTHAGKLFVITTPDVWRLHGEQVRRALAKKEFEILFFPGGEENKRLNAVEQLAEGMIARGGDRTSIVIGFGGGIVTDISGFLAAIFMRGVGVVQIPTTLLAQVDAAIGGKTGVNLVSGKNLIGSFHQPAAVLIDPELLGTLPAREYRAGLFEVIKCGIIRDRGLFDMMSTRMDDVLMMQPEVVDDLIAAAIRIKADIVAIDERETDLRRILNFGHTIGHALEAETQYLRFLHGEAVAWGMLGSTRLAELTGMLASEAAERIRRTVCQYGPLPSPHDLDPDRLFAQMAKDKKTLQGRMHFVLPRAIGQVEIVAGVEPAMVRQAILDSLQERA